jgi:hypothetical protein
MIAKFTVSLESPCIWNTYSFGICRVMPNDMPRRDSLLGWRRQKTSPTIGPIERGQCEHWALVASVLEHKDNVGITLVKVVLVSLILCPPVILVLLFLLVRFNTKTCLCKMSIL